MIKIFIAHTITAAQGGTVIGVYPTYKRAKAALVEVTGWPEGCTDWGHFIRVGELGKTFANVLSLDRADQKEVDKAMEKYQDEKYQDELQRTLDARKLKGFL
jgi:hypothetical protein